ncbi:MAG TPA: hypothetical protein ENH02_01840 [Bacteroidetes bacterium]|nr:hypothetical protein [Bacteroidota bacterium]
MKKILLLVAALLFSAASVFSQTYVVSVSWEHNECNCLDQGNSYYGVKVVIQDVANDMVVVEGKEVKVDFGTYTVDVSVPEVLAQCEDQTLQFPPNFKVMVGVAVICDYTIPPESICNAYQSHNYTCSDFADGNVNFTDLQFE